MDHKYVPLNLADVRPKIVDYFSQIANRYY